MTDNNEEMTKPKTKKLQGTTKIENNKEITNNDKAMILNNKQMEKNQKQMSKKNKETAEYWVNHIECQLYQSKGASCCSAD